MSVSLKVKVIAGYSVKEVATDMIRLAKLTGTMVEAKYEGVMLIALESYTPEQIETSFWQQVEQ